LLAAERPVLLADYVGRQHRGFHDLVALAETLGAPVFDINNRLNFPSRHPLNLSLDKTVFANADLIAMLDVSDWEQATSELDSTNRVVTSVVPETCEWIDIGFAELGISKWSMDYRRLQHCSHRVLADTALAIPQLTALCQARVAEDQGLAKKIEDRSRSVAERHQALRASWAEEARRDWDASPLTLPRLASEVWDAVQDKDWVLSAGTLRGWARRLWDLDQPYRHPGKSLGTATQIGISLGVALAHKGSGRLVIDLQPDGDLMFDLGALWFAAKHEIPLLVVMFNNRAYYNDWEHQIRMARQRGTPEARAHIGMDLFGPNPDFAALARAIAQVEAGKPALIDTVTQHR